MTTLIVPAAGESTRFGSLRPKFLLQHPHGKSMLAAGLEGLSPSVKSALKAAIIIVQEDHMKDVDENVLSEQVRDSIGLVPRFVRIENQTNSQVETIIRGIDVMSSDGPILVKDCDNYISFPDTKKDISENYVAFASLKKNPEVVAFNKAFIQMEVGNRVYGIAEKEIISPYIYTGLTRFSSASSFIAAQYSIEKQGITFVSDIIKVFLDQGYEFFGLEADKYFDWGTAREWQKYLNRFSTLLIDVDGVVTTNMSPVSKSNNWSKFTPISENVEALLAIQELENTKLVFLTARSLEYKDNLIAHLTGIGFRNFELICGLPHAKRILVNDFADSNPYPSALAINLERNSNSLSNMLSSVVNRWTLD